MHMPAKLASQTCASKKRHYSSVLKGKVVVCQHT